MHLGCAYSITTNGSLSSGSPCSSRPGSRAASLCNGIGGGGNSSGYESTSATAAVNARSHLGPHFSEHNMPRANSPEPRYNSLKPRRRKQHQYQRQAAQFYSLRLCKKHQQYHNHHHHRQSRNNSGLRHLRSDEENEGDDNATTKTKESRKYQLYAIPIYRSEKCPHSGGSSRKSLQRSSFNSSSKSLSLRSLEYCSSPTSTLSRTTSEQTVDVALADLDDDNATPPVLVPRITDKTDPSKHTYQNVPSPVYPPEQVCLIPI